MRRRLTVRKSRLGRSIWLVSGTTLSRIRASQLVLGFRVAVNVCDDLTEQLCEILSLLATKLCQQFFDSRSIPSLRASPTYFGGRCAPHGSPIESRSNNRDPNGDSNTTGGSVRCPVAKQDSLSFVIRLEQRRRRPDRCSRTPLIFLRRFFATTPWSST